MGGREEGLSDSGNGWRGGQAGGGGPLVASYLSSGCREESQTSGLGGAAAAAGSEPLMFNSPFGSAGAGYGGRGGVGSGGDEQGGGSPGDVDKEPRGAEQMQGAVGRVLMFTSPVAPGALAAGGLAGGVEAGVVSGGGAGWMAAGMLGAADARGHAAAAVAIPLAARDKGAGGVSDTLKLQQQMQELTMQWNAMDKRK